MKTLDQLGAEILAAIEATLDGVPHGNIDASVHAVPENMFAWGVMKQHGSEIYFLQQYRPTRHCYPEVAFFSEFRPPTEAERQALDAQAEAERTQYEQTKNTEPITGEELPF